MRDVIVLAAGKNERLSGIVAPYHKPLLVVNGKPLIVKAVDSVVNIAERDTMVVGPINVGRVVIVCSPSNAQSLVNVFAHTPYRRRIHWVIQPEAVGVVDAIARGAEVCTTEQVTVLCGDNLFDVAQLERVITSHEPSVAVSRMEHSPECVRFTQVIGLDDNDDVKRVGRLPLSQLDEDGVTVWLGPVSLSREAISQSTLEADGHGSVDSVEDLINYSISMTGPLCVVYGNTVDVGVPEMMP